MEEKDLKTIRGYSEKSIKAFHTLTYYIIGIAYIMLSFYFFASAFESFELNVYLMGVFKTAGFIMYFSTMFLSLLTEFFNVVRNEEIDRSKICVNLFILTVLSFIVYGSFSFIFVILYILYIISSDGVFDTLKEDIKNIESDQ